MRLAALALVVSFHHIHVNDVRQEALLAYYARLFDGATTRPAQIGEERGIESFGIYLLVTSTMRMPAEEGSAGWHFGWGTIALDEAYDRHRMQEIEWELPLPGFAKGLHLHLESQDPVAAAEWYRDVLGATIETAPEHAAVQPLNPVHRKPAGIVRLQGVGLAIYKARGPLGPSRGHRIDHIAFKVPDLAAARRALEEAEVKVLQADGRLGPHDTLMVEGPDRLAIELIGPPVLKR